MPRGSSNTPKSPKAGQARVMSLSEAARVLGKHRNTVAGWLAAGAPAVQRAQRSDRRDWQIDVAAVVEWRIERAVAAERERLEAHHAQEAERLEHAIAAADDDSEPMTRSEALRRRAVVEARLRELDLAEREGDVASISVLETFTVDLFTSVRQRFLYMPGKLAPILAAESSPPRCQKLLDDEIRETLTAIADSAAEDTVERTVEETQARAGGSR
jgi:phage terminase Nu1 subunit (DNA packaging protein)